MTSSMKIITVCTLLLYLGSCATIFRGSNEPVHFTSTPENARVELGNGLDCTSTPCSITVPRKINTKVTFIKEGCEEESTYIRGNISTTGVVLMFLGGLIGVVVDLATGAANDVTPNPVDVKLSCE